MNKPHDAALEPRRRTFDVGDGAISYLEWEGPSPDAPLLQWSHANGFNAETYRTLLAPLARRFRIRALDMRGHGHSTARAVPEEFKTWEVFRDDLIRFLQIKGEEPLILAGHSLGGTISLLTAAARPDLVRGIVLAEPVIVSRRMAWMFRVFRALGVKHPRMSIAEAAERRRAEFPDRDAVIEAYRGRGAFSTWPDEVLRDYVHGGTVKKRDGGVALGCQPQWEAAIYRAQATYIWRRIRQVRCPITLMYGAVASTSPSPVATRFKRVHPETRIIRIDDASHFLPMEYPGRVRDEIKRLADAVSG